jgi:plasmid stabilization system protein ParE
VATVIYAPEADDDLVGIVEYMARDKPRAARLAGEDSANL